MWTKINYMTFITAARQAAGRYAVDISVLTVEVVLTFVA
jgi:hypothetical protein